MMTALLIAAVVIAIILAINLSKTHRRKRRMSHAIVKLNAAIDKAWADYAAQVAIAREQAARIDVQAAEIGALKEMLRIDEELEAQVSAAADRLNFAAPAPAPVDPNFEPSGN
jgi:hypothetical protein